MRYLLIAFLLTGCTVVPVKQKFPDAPKEMMTSCNELKLIDKNETKLSEVVSNVVSNYSDYHECKAKNDAWIEWYKKQKKNFESKK